MDDLKWALDGIRARQLDYLKYQDYYYGAHVLAFATDKMRNAFGSMLKAFADNLCPVVVDTVADRLQIASFTDEQNESIGELTASIWRKNRMDRRAGETHLEALRSGDGYLIVWPDAAGFPRLYPNAGARCTVEYDTEEPGLVTKGAKMWYDTPRELWRLNLYYTDRLEKYAFPSKLTDFPSGSGAFQPYEVPGESWPLPNQWSRVPLFHFPNNATTGEFGRSELADVIPLQNGLNKSVTDMLVAMEFVALPQRWIAGVEAEIDELTGQPRRMFEPGADRIWTVATPDTKFGEFAAANLAQFIQVQESFRVEIARVSRTPLHHLMPSNSAFPSGEAMKTAEQPLIAKVKDRQIAWGNVWEDVMSLALVMSGVSDAQLTCNWVDTTPRNEETVLKNLEAKKRLGVSQRQVLREAGYTDEQIDGFEEENQAAADALGAQLLTAFDRDAPVGGKTSVTERQERANGQPE